MGGHRDINARCFYNSPTDYQALVTLLQTGGFNLYSSIKSIFGTLVWMQQQQSDYQAAGPNGVSVPLEMGYTLLPYFYFM